MIYSERPKFIIKRCMQKSEQTGIYFDDLVTKNILTDVCFRATGRIDYDFDFVGNNYQDEFLDATYNHGRLGILQYRNTVIYISFSDEKCEGRNSGIQSIPTAFNRFYMCPHEDKRLCFYFLPCRGNNATPYYLFMYRLMKTAGFEFLNMPQNLHGQINSFSSIDDIIRARRENREKNSGNNAIYIVKNATHDYEIYGKTYGANKYDTSLICYAISNLAHKYDQVTLYEYNEKDLKELPASSLSVIKAMGNIDIINIDKEIEKKELETNDSLRSPLFNARLLDRLGERHCVLCDCGVSELVQGAHIWPVANIKRIHSLSEEEKLAYATDGQNGLWMCQNHHKLFDSNILFLSPTGQVYFRDDLDIEDKEYIESITTVSHLSQKLITPSFSEYVNKRYQYVFS